MIAINRIFLLYERVLRQQQNDKNKIYLLHEPQVYCMAKGKDHKQFEYGSKASIASTAKDNLIVGVVSHEQNLHDSHTLPEILRHVEASRGKRGKREVNGTQIILPGKALKKDSRLQKDKKRKQCRRRAANELIIGHMKSDYRMARSYLKSALGDHINLLLAAVAWNLKQWLIAIVWLFFPWKKMQIACLK